MFGTGEDLEAGTRPQKILVGHGTTVKERHDVGGGILENGLDLFQKVRECDLDPAGLVAFSERVINTPCKNYRRSCKIHQNAVHHIRRRHRRSPKQNHKPHRKVVDEGMELSDGIGDFTDEAGRGFRIKTPIEGRGEDDENAEVYDVEETRLERQLRDMGT